LEPPSSEVLPSSEAFLSSLWLDFLPLYSLSAAFPAYVVLAATLVGLSGILSGFEAAFFSLQRAEFEAIQNSKSATDQFLVRVQRNPQRLLATLLIANNLVNVGFILLATFLLMDVRQAVTANAVGWLQSDALWLGLELLIITGVLLFLGEITPKVYATHRQLRFLRLFGGVVRAMYSLLLPLSWALSRASAFIYALPRRPDDTPSVQELHQAINLAGECDIQQQEKHILRALVNLDHISAKAIMRARVDIQALDLEDSLDEVLTQLKAWGYSRVPVVEGSLDQVRGLLYVKDLLRAQHQDPNLDWHALIRPPFYVPENKKIGSLLNEFKEKRLHIAIVVDEFGGTAGLVTLQDILEEIFGHISEENKPADLVFEQLSPTEFVFEGRTSLLDVCRLLHLDDSFFETVKGEHDSLGGLILELHGKLPEPGTELHFDGFAFVVDAATDRVIERVRVKLPEPANP
jgi:gliding motility-associated protein GldE